METLRFRVYLSHVAGIYEQTDDIGGRSFVKLNRP